MNEKLGHQAPKGYVMNRYFNYVYIKGDLHYCYSHDFVYDCEEEERKLYNAEPCYYTDARYRDGGGNYFKDTYLYQSRARWSAKHTPSLKACMRIVEQCRNIPVGTIVDFKRDWYYTRKNSRMPIPMSYRYKVRKENSFDPEYQINGKSYSRNFDDDKWAQELTDALRANGFIVSVSKGNPNRLLEMVATAAAYTGQSFDKDIDDEGQIATAYGHGRKIGFSTGDNSYRGYSYGCEWILYDFFGEFNKWSQAIQIHKTTPIEDIIKELTDETPRD